MKGLLLSNLGTPEGSDVLSVKNFLGEFLMDRDVISLPWPLRYLLVHGVILRKRPEESAKNYQKIWTNEGSPLLVNSVNFASKIQDRLYPRLKVKLGMRYGNPSLRKSLLELQEAGVTELIVTPLYPQYAEATTVSTLKKVEEDLASINWKPKKITFIKDFFHHESFARAQNQLLKKYAKSYQYDHVLMSFHGLPIAQIKKVDTSKQHCLKSNSCCDNWGQKNRYCYRAQCFETGRLIANFSGIPQSQFTVSFQSRFGRSKWIQPYTEEVIDSLIKKGVKRLLVMCPAFVADCLETLEEIEIRLKEDFIAKGGEDFKMLPSLNSEDFWADAFVSILEESLAEAHLTTER